MTSRRDFPPIDPDAGALDLLIRAAERFADRGVAIFDGRGRRYERRTYADLLDAVRQAAGRWSALGVEPGDRVMVSLPTSWAWIDAWLGALAAGALPVAVAPGAALGGGQAHLDKLDLLVERLGARYLAGADGMREQAASAGAERAAVVAIGISELSKVTPASVEPGRYGVGDDIAFLQLTSGSTGVPRAVQISHRAALHNCRANDLAIGAPRGAPCHQYIESVVAWLPLHHDMGLIGCLFLSMYAGLDLWLFPGTTFLARPRTWLDHLGQHGQTLAPAPNFGYQLCLERMSADARQGLDLSSWQEAMTGAEMVRPETVRGFCDAFAEHGFRPEVFRPCYGLAEGTLSVTFDQQGKGMRTLPMPASAGEGMALSEVVCVGAAIDGTTVEIVDPAGRPMQDGDIGAIRVTGPSLFSGYWRDQEANDESLDEGCLMTGDLGFLDRGELYITGRSKDLLIIRGHNVMPHEIEWQAEAVAGGGGSLRAGAFSIARDADGEQAIVVVETLQQEPSRLADMAGDIRGRVGKSLSLPLADVVFVRRGRIPKTTSGKVQRRQLRHLYLTDGLDTYDL